MSPSIPPERMGVHVLWTIRGMVATGKATSQVSRAGTDAVWARQELWQTIPDRLKLLSDERVAQVGRMEIKIKRPGKPEPSFDRHESLAS